MERIIRMIMNRLLRKGINFGVDKAMKLTSTSAKPAKDISPADRSQAQRARDVSKRARQAAKLTRRLGR